MEVPLQAQVECTDGVCGRSEYLLLNPITEQVTHLVVQEPALPHTEYIVPIDLISETNDNVIHLRCSKSDIEKMDRFIQTRFVAERVPDLMAYHGLETTFYWPYVTHEITIYASKDFQQIPADEIAIHRGTRVEASDGYIGKVDEFVVNPKNGQITHLVMREGHLWGKKEVVIPLTALDDRRLDDTRDDTVFLKLAKHQVESLPTIPLHRRLPISL